MNVALLHDVEQAHLDLAGKIRQFVDREDSPIGARKQTVMHGQFAAQRMAALCRLDRVNVADNVRDGDVRGGELFDVPVISLPVFDRRAAGLLLDQIAASPANRRKWAVVDFTAGHHGDDLIQKFHQPAENPALGLTTQSQQNHVVARQDGIHDLGNDRVFIADDSRKHRLVCLKFWDKIRPHFIFNGPCRIGLVTEFA